MNIETRGYIYAIINGVNGKRLVGQTIQDPPVKRWWQHKQQLDTNCHKNSHIQHAYVLYGSANFSFEIIKEIICSQIELDKLEEEYRLKYFPNVYNMKSGGGGGCKFGEESKKKMSNSQKKLAKNTNCKTQKTAAKKRWSTPKSKIWRKEMNDKIWNDIEIKNRMLINLMTYATDSEWKSKLGKEIWKKQEYRDKFEINLGSLKSPDGTIYKNVKGLRPFCREQNLDPSSLKRVIDGKYKQHKGWTTYG